MSGKVEFLESAGDSHPRHDRSQVVSAATCFKPVKRVWSKSSPHLVQQYFMLNGKRQCIEVDSQPHTVGYDRVSSLVGCGLDSVQVQSVVDSWSSSICRDIGLGNAGDRGVAVVDSVSSASVPGSSSPQQCAQRVHVHSVNPLNSSDSHFTIPHNTCGEHPPLLSKRCRLTCKMRSGLYPLPLPPPLPL